MYLIIFFTYPFESNDIEIILTKYVKMRFVRIIVVHMQYLQCLQYIFIFLSRAEEDVKMFKSTCFFVFTQDVRLDRDTAYQEVEANGSEALQVRSDNLAPVKSNWLLGLD